MLPAVEKASQAYWITGSVTAALAAAGRSYQWYRNHQDEIQQRLAVLSEKSLENLKARRGRIVAELEAIAYAGIEDFVVLDPSGQVTGLRFPTDKRSAIQMVQVGKGGALKLSLFDRLRALDLLARISGLAVDRVDVTSGGKPIQPISITYEVIPMRKPVETPVSVQDGNGAVVAKQD